MSLQCFHWILLRSLQKFMVIKVQIGRNYGGAGVVIVIKTLKCGLITALWNTSYLRYFGNSGSTTITNGLHAVTFIANVLSLVEMPVYCSLAYSNNTKLHTGMSYIICLLTSLLPNLPPHLSLNGSCFTSWAVDCTVSNRTAELCCVWKHIYYTL